MLTLLWDPNFLLTFEIKDDFLLPSLEDDLRLPSPDEAEEEEPLLEAALQAEAA